MLIINHEPRFKLFIYVHLSPVVSCQLSLAFNSQILWKMFCSTFVLQDITHVHSYVKFSLLMWFFFLVPELEGSRAWCGRRPRARHHGYGGGAAGAIWRHPTAAARADGVSRRRGAGQDQCARRAAGDMQEALHIVHRWYVPTCLTSP